MGNKLNKNKASRNIQRFSGGIAHDMNNIIMVINGYSGCLKRTPELKEKQIRYVEQIEKATAQAGEITDILLTICEGVILNMSYFNLQELLEIFMKEKSNGKDSNHKMGMISEIDESNIYFDKNRMLTVLENLYQNSIYPDEESRQISYKISKKILSQDNISSEVVHGAYIVLDIYDDGPGIEDEISSDIFEPYFSTKPRGKGRGLGLTLCKGIIHQCESFIENIQGIEKGCLIRIYFPDTSKSSDGPSSNKSDKSILEIDKKEII